MDREKLAENLMTFIPMMFKKLKKGFPSFHISKQQLELLFLISKEDGKLMSHYSEKMMVSKPNLTVMADKLIEEGFIEREFDQKDRRIIILKITSKGEDFLNEHREKVRMAIVEKFNLLSDNDIKRLNELIDEMRSIFDKIKKQ